MDKYIYPKIIKKGDKAIIITPSGNTDEKYIVGVQSVLREWGLDVHIGKYAYEKFGRFGGTTLQRQSDLQSAMDDKEAKLIFCSRGGYGAVHLLEKLDFSTIAAYPKWLLGYSDITLLHQTFLKNKIVSLHSPMARHLTEDSDDAVRVSLKKFLTEGAFGYTTSAHFLNNEGIVEGRLFGGNLAVFCSIIGTSYISIPEKGILFIEDIGESPYKIDRMIWQLKLSGILGKISGLIVGQFSDCTEDPLMGGTIYESIRNIVSEYAYPVAFDFPVGHVSENFPLPHGEKVILNVSKDKVTLRNKY